MSSTRLAKVVIDGKSKRSDKSWRMKVRWRKESEKSAGDKLDIVYLVDANGAKSEEMGRGSTKGEMFTGCA